MKIAFLKFLGTAHGIFGLFILLALWVAYSQELFSNIAIGRAALKIGGTIVGGVLLLACAWAAWRNYAWAAPIAWMALAVFVVSASGDEVFLHGLRGFTFLMPTFYVAVAVRAAAALAMSYLAMETRNVAGGA